VHEEELTAAGVLAGVGDADGAAGEAALVGSDGKV
jgi:hypothetical protein